MPVLTDPIEGRHASLLPPLEIVGGEERYKIEEVMDSRLRHRKLEYLVRWKGYGHEENSWIAECDLEAPDLIVIFYKVNPNAPKHISALAFRRMGFQPYYRCFMHQDTAP
jgi:Chromo (CHRromatin Organisation MOdifier) domain